MPSWRATIARSAGWRAPSARHASRCSRDEETPVILAIQAVADRTVDLDRDTRYSMYLYDLDTLEAVIDVRKGCDNLKVGTCSQTSVIGVFVIHIPRNPNTLAGNLLYHFIFTMIQ